jgi:hypothetical protein
LELEGYFSRSYEEARRRFRSLAQENAGSLESEAIGHTSPSGGDLTIDAARFGPVDAERLLVVSSGTHGAEGFMGSAIQLAFLDSAFELPPKTALLLIHAVNPFGFSHLRRVNEDNVDLNRNFLLDGQPYSGSDPGYADFDPMLNPKTPPGGLEFFLPRAVWNILIHGLPKLKNSLAQGQYDFPQGLFFGGSAPSETKRILSDRLPGWVGSADRILHLDLHTGLGRYGTYVLAAGGQTSDADKTLLSRHFGGDCVQLLEPGGVLYEIRGEFGMWCRSLFPGRTYHALLAEFGTYNILRVIGALRQENRATHWGDASSQAAARKELREVFAPSSPGWQRLVAERGLKIVQQGLELLSG